MISKKKIAVLYHIFYEDTLMFIADQLESLSFLEPFYLFNISADAPDQISIRKFLSVHFPNSIITISSNKGKDIGGKFILINTCIQFGFEPDWFIFLHDKKSLQALNAKTWKNDLLKIIDKSQVHLIDKIISDSSSTGIIAAQTYVLEEKMNKDRFLGTNGDIMTDLLRKYKVYCNTYKYVAGTMFWAKADVLLEFFRKHDPLSIRQTFEDGNVLDNFKGSNTHSWERMLCWIILSRSLTIKTV